MGLSDVTRDAVLAAVRECDQLGREKFLAQYGFGPARKYLLQYEGRFYDSKAIMGAAHRHSAGRALKASEFSGGDKTVVARLSVLGFDVRDAAALPQPVRIGAHLAEQPLDQGIESQPEMPDGNQTPGRRYGVTQRVVRSTEVAEYLKRLHDHRCQACETRLAIGTRGYSEAAHIRALGRPHDGPDIPANVLCLCPNCHVLFDSGALIIDDDLVVWVNGKRGQKLRTHSSHFIDREHLAYHRSVHQ